jgi:hypothetical protein
MQAIEFIGTFMRRAALTAWIWYELKNHKQKELNGLTDEYSQQPVAPPQSSERRADRRSPSAPAKKREHRTLRANIRRCAVVKREPKQGGIDRHELDGEKQLPEREADGQRTASIRVVEPFRIH